MQTNIRKSQLKEMKNHSCELLQFDNRRAKIRLSVIDVSFTYQLIKKTIPDTLIVIFYCAMLNEERLEIRRQSCRLFVVDSEEKNWLFENLHVRVCLHVIASESLVHSYHYNMFASFYKCLGTSLNHEWQVDAYYFSSHVLCWFSEPCAVVFYCNV